MVLSSIYDCPVVATEFLSSIYDCSAGEQPTSSTVFLSHVPPASASSSSLPNSVFLSQHSSSSLQLQPAEHGMTVNAIEMPWHPFHDSSDDELRRQKLKRVIWLCPLHNMQNCRSQGNTTSRLRGSLAAFSIAGFLNYFDRDEQKSIPPNTATPLLEGRRRHSWASVLTLLPKYTTLSP